LESSISTLFVQEFGDEEEENYSADHVGPYEHTHVFVKWVKRLDVCNARAWDVDDIHPIFIPPRA